MNDYDWEWKLDERKETIEKQFENLEKCAMSSDARSILSVLRIMFAMQHEQFVSLHERLKYLETE